jgi:AraC-like DNA-binding protein
LYRHRVPRPPLDAFVQWIWLYRQEPRPLALERVLPTGAAQLIINLKEDETRLYDPDREFRCVTTAGTVFTGVQSRYQIIDTSEQEYVAGIAFKPGGAAAFMRAPAHELTDLDVPLEALWHPRHSTAVRTRLLESPGPDAMLDAIEVMLLEMWTRQLPHPAVAFALSVFDRRAQTTSIAAVTQAIGMSAKRFIERFKIEVGVTPKRYCRIRRFQQAVARTHRRKIVDWAEVALDCGYFDQAHFIHDFRSFAGVTPTAYQSARTPFQNHVKFLQSENAGA